MKSFQLSRRAVLRGVGTAMALPWLEMMAPRHASAQTAPLRFACIYSPNGFVMHKVDPGDHRHGLDDAAIDGSAAALPG